MAIDTAFVKQFSSNIKLLSQQQGSRLRNAVRVESVTGEEAYFDQLASTTAVLKTTRNSDTPLILGDHKRRRVTMYDYEWATLIDKEDQLKMLADLNSPFNQDAANALGRAIDTALITAATGSAATGKAGGTSVTHAQDGGTQIAVATNNLGMAKLLAAKKALDKADVDPMIPRYIALTASQISSLLGTTQVTSSDYNTVKALATGDVNAFCGFTFIHTELLTLTTTTRTCIAWAKDGLLLAIGKDINAEITRRADKSYATQVYLSMSVGATRMEGVKVVDIQASEA